MANMLFAWPNWIDSSADFAEVEFSGGLWNPDLPISELLNPSFIDVARSVDVTNDSTQFWIDLGTLRNIALIAIPWIRGVKSNGKVWGYKDLTVRARVFESKDTSSTLKYDSGVIDQNPIIYDMENLQSTNPSFISGKATNEELSDYNWKLPWWHVPSSAVLGRYIHIQIDASNSNLSYIEIPRVFISPGWIPTINMSYGTSIQVEDLTQSSQTFSGAKFFDVKPKRRVVNLIFDHIEEDESLQQLFDAVRRLGIHKQIFFIFNIDDIKHKPRRNMVCTIREADPLEFARFRYNSGALQLEEVLE